MNQSLSLSTEKSKKACSSLEALQQTNGFNAMASLDEEGDDIPRKASWLYKGWTLKQLSERGWN